MGVGVNQLVVGAVSGGVRYVDLSLWSSGLFCAIYDQFWLKQNQHTKKLNKSVAAAKHDIVNKVSLHRSPVVSSQQEKLTKSIPQILSGFSCLILTFDLIKMSIYCEVYAFCEGGWIYTPVSHYTISIIITKNTYYTIFWSTC